MSFGSSCGQWPARPTTCQGLLAVLVQFGSTFAEVRGPSKSLHKHNCILQTVSARALGSTWSIRECQTNAALMVPEPQS